MKHQRFTQSSEFEPRQPAFPPAALAGFEIEVTHFDDNGQTKRVRRLSLDRLLAPFK